MAEERKQTYTIRLPERVAMLLEQTARAQGVAPTTLIQAVISRRFRRSDGGERERELAAGTVIAARLDVVRKTLDQLERKYGTALEQLRFEIVKTRSALFHSLDQTLGAAAVDQIIAASEQTAREYIAGLGPHPEGSS